MARQTPLNCSGHTRPVVDLAFSNITPDGYFLISACKDGKPLLRNGMTGDWIGTFEGHKGAVWSARLNSDATKAVTGSADYTAKIWNAVNGDELLSIPHKHIVRAVDWCPDDQRILTASHEKIIRIYDVAQPETELIALHGHTKNIRLAQFHKDTNTVLSAGEDGAVRIWDLRSGQQARSIDIGAEITSVEEARKGDILTITYGKTVSFWDADSYTKIKSVDISCPVHSASLHPDRTRFVAGGLDFYLHVFDYDTMQELEVYKGHHGPVHCVRYSPDGMLYASGSEDGTVRLWQHEVGKEYGLWRYNKPDETADGKQ